MTLNTLNIERWSKVCDIVILLSLLFGIIIVGVVLMYHMPQNQEPIPLTVLSAVVVDVRDEGIAGSQLVRGRSLGNVQISYDDAGEWSRCLPVTCEDVGVRVVYVRPHFQLWSYETIVIIQDATNECEDIVYGP